MIDKASRKLDAFVVPNPDDTLRVTAAHYKALGHPFRQRLLFSLSAGPATISQLAVQLGAAKGSVDHHLKVLVAAGLVCLDSTRTTRGGTERYYRRGARRLEIEDAVAEPSAAMFAAVAEELRDAEDDPLLALRHVRLTPERAAKLSELLMDLVSNTAEAGPGEPTYGLLVSLYRRAERGAPLGRPADDRTDDDRG